MNPKTLHQISYGLYVVTARMGDTEDSSSDQLWPVCCHCKDG